MAAQAPVLPLVDVGVPVWGGYAPSMPPSQLPSGASPLNQDVIYIEGGVKTRPGLFSKYGVLPGEQLGFPPSVNGLTNYATVQRDQTLLVWDTLGNLYQETGDGILSLVAAGGSQFATFNGTSIFGRKYMAFGVSIPDIGTGFNNNLWGGVDIPRQFDGTNFDRVSQVGPGQGPNPVDFLPAPATIANTAAGTPVNIAAASTGLVLSGPVITKIPIETFVDGRISVTYQYIIFETILTVSTSSPHGLIVGQLVQIAGATNTIFNGNYSVLTVPTASTLTVAVHLISTTGNSGGGTITGLAASAIRTANTVTINTGAAHNFQTGWFVQIAGLTNNALPGSVTTMSPLDGVVTVTMSQAHGLVVGTSIIITGASDTTANGTFQVATIVSATVFTFNALTGTALITGATISTTFDGTFQISTIPSTTSFTYFQIGPNTTQSNAGATATIIGSITPGLHGVSVAFITRQGFITPPSPPIYYNAAGNKLVTLSNIPIGPSNIVGRLLIFTPAVLPPATAGTFFAILPQMQINDNTTTSVIIDFIDAVLESPGSFQAQYLFSEVELGECFGTEGYSDRTVWIGERNKLSNLVNMTFDGGWALGSGWLGADVPLGWNPGAYLPEPGITFELAANAGGTRSSAISVWQDAYAIVSNGNEQTGGIYQGVYQDAFNVGIMSSFVDYSCRFKLSANVALSNTEIFFIQIVSPSLGVLGSATIPGNDIPTNGTFDEFIIDFGLGTTTVIPPDAVIQIFAMFLLNGDIIYIDNIEPFPTLAPVNTSIARVSYAENPEAIDSVTGQISVRPNDGQQLRAAFPIRNNLYLAKDSYLAYVTDDGINEPASWPVNEVSNQIGICGPNAWDVGEEWAAFAHRSGLYLFWGADPVKVTQEIQYDASNTGKITWNSINWDQAQNVWVRIDTVNKRILVGAPINTQLFDGGVGPALMPNVIFVMDYEFSPSGEAAASSGAPSYSQYTGKILQHGGARKWTIWNISANSAVFSERPDGTAHLLMGNGIQPVGSTNAGAGNGKIYDVLTSQLSDDGAAIDSFYQTYGQPDQEEEEGLQLHSHRKIINYLTGRAAGSGIMSIVAITDLRNVPVRGVILNSPNAVPATPVSDDFFRANESPLNSENWTAFLFGSPALQVVSDQCCPTVIGVDCFETFTGTDFSNNQSATITLGNVAGVAAVLVRASPTGAYIAEVEGPLGPSAAIQLFAGAGATLIGSFTGKISPGDAVTVSAVGTLITVLLNDKEIISVNDSIVVSGVPGIMVGSVATVTDSAIAGFSAQNAFAAGEFIVQDFERFVEIAGERTYWQVGTNEIGSAFQIEKLVASMKLHPTSPVRGFGP